MIISGNFKTAKLDAIKMFMEEDTKSVEIFFDKRRNCWCVAGKDFSSGEYKMIISGDFETAKLNAIKKLIEEDIYFVEIFFDERKNRWFIDWDCF